MKRKICGAVICLLLTAVSLFGISGAKAAGSYDIVRIKLSMGEPVTVPVFIDGNYSIAEDETVLLPRQLYTVKIENSKLSLYYSDTKLYSGDTITFKQHEASEGLNNFIYLNNTEHGYCGYLGDLHFTIYSGYIRVINHIYLDEYLCGVVPNEMSNSWPLEALKAQAITARTYAVRYIKAANEKTLYPPYDMVDTPANQTYHGYDPSDDNAIRAVNETAGQVLMCNGSFVETYYAASNGGQIDIPQHIWSSTNPLMPYHVIKDDPFDIANPYSKEETLIFPKVFSDTQSVEYTSDTYQIYEKKDDLDPNVYASNALRYIKISCLPAVAAAGYTAEVTGDIEVVGVNSITPHTHEGNHGGVGEYDGCDYTGENNCRVYEKATVNMTVLANKYEEDESSIMLGDINGDGKIDIIDYTMLRLSILGLSEHNKQQALAADVNEDWKTAIEDYTMVRLHILGLLKIKQKPITGTLVQEPVTVTFEIDLHELDKTGGLYKSFYSSSLRLFAIEETETSWNIHQRRFGHGVGMSQRGAQAMANGTITDINPTGEPWDSSQILQFYYPNTTISTVDIEKPVLTASATAPNLGATNAIVIGCDTLNVRSTPDTSNSPIGKFFVDTRIEVTGSSSDWYVINYFGVTAYVHSDYVALD